MSKTHWDRRKEPRYRVNKPGSIRCVVTDTQVDVDIQDMSAGGARLQAKGNTAHMHDIELHIHAENLYVPAHIKWRHEDQLGVATFNSGATVIDGT